MTPSILLTDPGLCLSLMTLLSGCLYVAPAVHVWIYTTSLYL